jgi:ribonucleoside-diphosphate reductase alpha chain
MAGASGRKLDETYKLAWLRGLKTTYYLRTTSATYSEKSTVSAGRLNAVAMAGSSVPQVAHTFAAAPDGPAAEVAASDIQFCSLDNPDCEACQ